MTTRGFKDISGLIKERTAKEIVLHGIDLPGPVRLRLSSLALSSRLFAEAQEIGAFVTLSVVAGAKERAMRQVMRARLEAERDHGFPNSGAGGTTGYWTDWTRGYIDLTSYPVALDPASANLEPIPPDEQQLPDHQVRQPRLTDQLGEWADDDSDKASRKATRRRNFITHGEVSA